MQCVVCLFRNHGEPFPISITEGETAEENHSNMQALTDDTLSMLRCIGWWWHGEVMLGVTDRGWHVKEAATTDEVMRDWQPATHTPNQPHPFYYQLIKSIWTEHLFFPLLWPFSVFCCYTTSICAFYSTAAVVLWWSDSLSLKLHRGHEIIISYFCPNPFLKQQPLHNEC